VNASSNNKCFNAILEREVSKKLIKRVRSQGRKIVTGLQPSNESIYRLYDAALMILVTSTGTRASTHFDHLKFEKT
jgi:hypothetical protein